MPAALRLLTTLVPEGARRRRAVAGWSAAGAAAGASGFVVGGLLTELVSWRAVFLVTFVLGLALAAATVAVVPRAPRGEARPVVPWASGLTLTVAIVALIGGTTLLGESGRLVAGLGLLLLATLVGLGFVLGERRGSAPLLPAAATTSPHLRWGAVASFANTATTSSAITLATLYLQDRLLLSPLQAAGLLLCFSVAVVVTAPWAPRLIGARGWAEATAAGLAAIAASNLVLGLVPTALGIGVASALGGIGIGIASVAATDMGTHVDTAAKSAAAALLNTAAQTGTAVGAAVALLLATLTGTPTTWVVIAVATAGTALLVLLRAPRTSYVSRPGDLAAHDVRR